LSAKVAAAITEANNLVIETSRRIDALAVALGLDASETFAIGQHVAVRLAAVNIANCVMLRHDPGCDAIPSEVAEGARIAGQQVERVALAIVAHIKKFAPAEASH
jgi:hypothetical protein